MNKLDMTPDALRALARGITAFAGEPDVDTSDRLAMLAVERRIRHYADLREMPTQSEVAAPRVPEGGC